MRQREGLSYYEWFMRMATDSGLSMYEKIDFPDKYREGYEIEIHNDILSKLPNLKKGKQWVLDIGCGCSLLPVYMGTTCHYYNNRLIRIDSQEMLDQLPCLPHVTNQPGRFPEDFRCFVSDMAGGFDVILAYSMIHYVFEDGSPYDFLDAALTLLSDTGEMLIGDVPNFSKRNRFFASQQGIAYHQTFMNTDELPEISPFSGRLGGIDDGTILGLILHARACGFDAYWLPQGKSLPMANRREDILIRRPR